MRITLDVTYDESTVYKVDDLMHALKHNMERYIGNGLLSPSGVEVVATYELGVERERK